MFPTDHLVPGAYVLPKRLFRFRSLASKTYREDELNNLAKGRVFVSSPNSFNDYYDCKPAFSIPTTEAALSFYEQAINLLGDRLAFIAHGETKRASYELDFRSIITEASYAAWAASLHKEQKEAESEKLLYLIRFLTLIKNDVAKQGVSEITQISQRRAEEWIERMHNLIYVACFSKRNDSLPMWYHYANNYQGICYEFCLADNVDPSDWLIQTRILERKAIFADVEYSGLRKTIDSTKMLSLEHALPVDTSSSTYTFSDFCRDTLFHKSPDWSYEEETRLLWSQQGETKGPLYFAMEPYRLTSVTLGPKCPHEIEAGVSQLAQEFPVAVFKSSFSSEKYGLDFNPL